MANTTVLNLPVATSLTGQEYIMGVQNGTSVRFTVDQVADIVPISLGVVPVFSTQQQAMAAGCNFYIDSTLGYPRMFILGAWYGVGITPGA